MSGADGEPLRDGHRARRPDWRPRLEGVPCRLVARAQTAPDGALAAAPVVTTYTLLVGPESDIRPTLDRIVGVMDRAGRPIEAGPFHIAGRLPRTGPAGARSHISLQLELRGGRHGPE